jgi:hypothetical protein
LERSLAHMVRMLALPSDIASSLPGQECARARGFDVVGRRECARQSLTRARCHLAS